MDRHESFPSHLHTVLSLQSFPSDLHFARTQRGKQQSFRNSEDFVACLSLVERGHIALAFSRRCLCLPSASARHRLLFQAVPLFFRALPLAILYFLASASARLLSLSSASARHFVLASVSARTSAASASACYPLLGGLPLANFPYRCFRPRTFRACVSARLLNHGSSVSALYFLAGVSTRLCSPRVFPLAYSLASTSARHLSPRVLQEQMWRRMY